MFRREFLKVSLGSVAVSCSLMSSSSLDAKDIDMKNDDRPNFIFILADDLGWGDLGCYGNPKIKTPNIDRLAAEGTRFTSFYVNSPVCSPTRVAIMTGQFPSQHSMHTQIFGSLKRIKQMKMPRFLDPKAVMLPRLFKESGYQTAHIGKWHLSVPQDKKGSIPEPKEYGIEFARLPDFNWKRLGLKWDHQRSSELYTDQAIEFIKQRDKSRPFFMQVWLNDPHNPYDPTIEQLKAYPEMPIDDNLKKYWSMVTEIDKQVGRIIKQVGNDALLKNTYIIFTSDNGPVDPSDLSSDRLAGLGSPGPFRGYKGSLYEGGIRTPFIVRCPGKVPKGKIDENTQISGVDMLPTFCSIAGIALPAGYVADGQDMSPAFAGTPIERVNPLMWFYPIRYRAATINQSPVLAIKDDKWKLLTNPDGSRVELYNINSDLTETNNLAEDYPDITRKLRLKLLDWYMNLPPNTIEPGAGEITYPWPNKKWDSVTESLD